jgi:hypothetical protein
MDKRTKGQMDIALLPFCPFVLFLFGLRRISISAAQRMVRNFARRFILGYDPYGDCRKAAHLLGRRR